MPQSIHLLGRRREFDYIEKDWLERLTTGSAHEWDIYIVKELVDNALDADEAQGLAPRVGVQMAYEAEGLEVRVSNLARFPTDYLERFFNLEEYVTIKDYFNAPTRGAQGNALKTILGIPYALRYFYFGNYDNLYKPLAITTSGEEHIVRLLIDEHAQRIKPEIEHCPLRRDRSSAARRRTDRSGTEIFVGIDRFRQQRPRTMADLHHLAVTYALWNPHAAFTWDILIEGKKELWEFPHNPQWHGKWLGTTSPISWYDYGQFRQLCFASAREYGDDYPLADLLSRFAGLDIGDGQGKTVLDKLSALAGHPIVALGDLQLQQANDHLLRDGLYPLMKDHSPIVDPTTLGSIGQTHIEAVLRDDFPIEGDVFYERVAAVNKDRPSVPFALEMTLAEFAADEASGVVPPGGAQRQIWFGINHTPTYRDPFYIKDLSPPDHPATEPVRGLDGFLDYYGLDQNTPLILAAHLICPNIQYQNYGKSELDDEPFKATLCQTLHTIITHYLEVREEQELDPRPVVWELMPGAIGEVWSNRACSFTQSQLICCLKARIASKGEEYSVWVRRPEATARLASLIVEYQRERGSISGLILPLRGRITLPSHPDDQVTLPLERIHALGSLLRQHGADKLFCVANPEFEDLLVANQFHNRYDLAILRSDGDLIGTFGEVINRLGREPSVPILLLHDASVDGCLLASRLRSRLVEAGVDVPHFTDLGLTPSQGQSLGLWTEYSRGTTARRKQLAAAELSDEDVAFLLDQKQRIGLEAFTPEGLARWFEARLAVLGLPPKAVPSAEAIHQQALERLREKLGWRIEALFNEATGLAALQDRIRLGLQERHRLTEMDFASRVHTHLVTNPEISWEQALDRVTDEICREILQDDEIDTIRDQVAECHSGART